MFLGGVGHYVGGYYTCNASTLQVVSNTMPSVYATLSTSEFGRRRIVDNYTVHDGSWNVLGIDPAGQNLYWVGGKGLVILPIPSNLLPQQGSAIQAVRKTPR